MAAAQGTSVASVSAAWRRCALPCQRPITALKAVTSSSIMPVSLSRSSFALASTDRTSSSTSRYFRLPMVRLHTTATNAVPKAPMIAAALPRPGVALWLASPLRAHHCAARGQRPTSSSFTSRRLAATHPLTPGIPGGGRSSHLGFQKIQRRLAGSCLVRP